MIVDAHVHFWDPRSLRYPWLEQIPALERPFLPHDYAAATSGIPVERLLVVECDCARDLGAREAEWFAELAASEPRIAGIVAFVDLTRPADLDRALDAVLRVSKVRGIRHNIQGEPRGFCLDAEFVRGVRIAGAHRLTFDLCVTHDQVAEVAELVSACPETTFVLDHCGKPAIRDQLRDPWCADVARLAELPNVMCKISGLLTEADLRRWRPEDVIPYAAHAAACFGRDRVMYGSDWPVVTLAGEYNDWFEVTRRLTERWSEAEQSAFYHDNAVRTYHL